MSKELFDKKFVHFMWDDELEGKECFVANDIAELRKAVENGDRRTVTGEYSEANPFKARGFFPFAYYDPNYECKRAYLYGKKIQIKNGKTWYDISEPAWEESSEYRIKPEAKRMTYRELAEWLAKGNGQAKTGAVAASQLAYDNIDTKDNEELPAEYKIRRWGSDEWIEPTVEVYNTDCKED